MKHLSLCISIFLLLTLAACGDNKYTEEKITPWQLNYFEGDLNNKLVSVKDPPSESLIHTAYALNYRKYEDGNWTTTQTFQEVYEISIPLTRAMGFSPAEDKKIRLEISLSPLNKGIYKIQHDNYSLSSSRVCIMYEIHSNLEAVYFPSKEPLILELTRVECPDIVPIIEGKLEGILYNISNPQDSIVIKNATFAAH